MASRLELHNKLIELKGDNNVYYQPPESKKMDYPAIRYSKTSLFSLRADNSIYHDLDCYEIIVIDLLPDNPIIKELLKLPYCSYERHYVSDNLNHDVLRIYF